MTAFLSRIRLAAGVLAACLLPASCAQVADRSVATGWSDARQLVLVTTAGWNASSGILRTYTRAADGWKAVGAPAPVTIGRSGAAWGVGLHQTQPGPIKVEGDGRAPAGIFEIGTAFGYASSEHTALHYAAMTASDYCVDVSGSPLYNRLVDTKKVGSDAVAGSTEPMRRDIHANGDQRYKLGFVIQHNANGQPGAGSCIFAHLWKAPGETTSGCTAMDEPVMRSLVAWLRPRQRPIFVLLPEAEYARLKSHWQLPDMSQD